MTKLAAVSALLIGILGGLAWGTTAALAAPTVVVPISGTVDGLPKSVYFSGIAEITTTLMTDPDLRTPPG